MIRYSSSRGLRRNLSNPAAITQHQAERQAATRPHFHGPLPTTPTLDVTSTVTPTATSNRAIFAPRAFSSSGFPPLHYEWSHAGKFYSQSDTLPQDKHTSGMVIFLHGLLGNGKNLKTMVRNLTKKNPHLLGLTMDLRGHGRSPSYSPPHSFEACAADAMRTIQNLSSRTPPLPPVTSIVGHSWGGRVAIQLANDIMELHKLRPPPKTWLLDVVPAVAHESVTSVLNAIYNTPSSAMSDKRQILHCLVTEGGLDVTMANWLVGSMTKTTDSRFVWGFDAKVVQELLPQFQTQDFHGLVSKLVTNEHNTTAGRVDLVRSGQNDAWTESTLESLRKLAEETTATIAGTSTVKKTGFHIHVLPNAGHWIHVDDLPGLLDIIEKEGLD